MIIHEGGSGSPPWWQIGLNKEDVEAVEGPPDGGWGWVIVAASFLCNMVLDGIGYSFGILLKPLMKEYGEGKGMISLV